MKRQIALVGTTALMLVLASCGGPGDAGSTGGEPGDDPLTLRIARTGGAAGDVLTDDLQRSLEEASAGAMTIEVATEWYRPVADSEQQIIKAVADGDVDLGWVGTRAFVELGVASLEALTAAFLVDSYELQSAILDTDIPRRMLAELETLGVIGLGVTAGQLRKPIGVEAPLLGIDDYAGLPFYVFRSQTGNEAVTALGAVPTGETTDNRDRGLQDGTIGGYEQSVAFHQEFHGLAPYLTLNVTLWPGTAVFVASPEMLDGLSVTQRQWLDTAVGDTVSRSVELANIDADLMDGICARGGRFAVAADSDVEALRDAVAPVYEKLETDPLTAELISEIRALKQLIAVDPLAVPDGCSGEAEARDQGVVAEGTDDRGVVNGRYRLEWEPDELVEAAGFDEPWVRRNAGTVLLTFESGRFDQIWQDGPSAGERCTGTYAISGNRLTMVASTDAAEWDCGMDSLGALLVDAAWQLTDSELILSDFALSDDPDATWWNEIFLGRKPLAKVA